MRVFFLLLVAGCIHQATSTGLTEADISCDTSLTYANFGQAFVQTNCLSCHDGGQIPNLSTQELVKEYTANILDVAVYTSEMPQNATLTNAERQLLGEWLQCGAP